MSATSNKETWLCWLKYIDPDTQEASIITRENGNNLYVINNKKPKDEMIENQSPEPPNDPLGNTIAKIAVGILLIFLFLYFTLISKS